MPDFETVAIRARGIEAALDTGTKKLAQALAAPVSTHDTAAISSMIGALEPHRAPLRAAVKSFNRVARHPRGQDTRAEAKIRSYFKAVSFRLTHWDRITAHLRAGLTPHPTPLRPPPEAASHTQLMVEVMYRTLHLQTNPTPQDAMLSDLGAFPDIALKFWPFVDLLRAATRVALAQRRPRPWRFIDIGCGGGTKVLTAASYFDQAFGMEYDPGYAASARRLLALANAPTAEIAEGDALTFDGYSAFDVVYFYRPLSDLNKMIELEERITAQVSPGTLLLAPYDGFLERHNDYGHGFLGRWLYVAHTSAEQASALVTEAELIGPDIRIPGALFHRRLGFWESVVAASYGNGLGITF